METKMPRILELKMQIMSEQIRVSRQRGNLIVTQIAERVISFPHTVSHIEKNAQTVSIDIYLWGHYALLLKNNFLLPAKENAMGKALQDLSL